ncbi:hypothetical protein QBL02_07415 [Leucobacter sp. UT-8R-CII-1-4]|uniref:hypothetical protein n=1 Tax=Leucobacter sp. UT-8R-CII-1-4 TaxID=3040075 RepID=UPI0024A9FEF4|nr:hypothetical protein [Leucobacter sp. UT-8R-CII-1-4]MDI6023371.1 hypothetical protein [Leucobacter sp. UT-8R-CII-1-4]
MKKTQLFRRIAVLTAAPLLLVAMAACSPSSGESEESSGASVTEADMQAWSMKYATCMQEQGIDYPDPPKDPNASMQAFNIDEMGGIEVFEAADKTCRGKLGEPPMTDEMKKMMENPEAMQEQSLKLAKCLRDQGYDVKDPTPGGGLTLDSEISPEAFEACGLGVSSMKAGQ